MSKDEDGTNHRITQVEDYEQFVGAETVDRILNKARKIGDMHVAHVNSTFYGGGVAELLGSLVLLINAAGVRSGWRAIQGSPDFFSVTKKMHNALQGGNINLSQLKKDIYETVVGENAVRNHLHHDLVVIHDPQPLPMIEHFRLRGPWVWRCHVDLTNPHAELWRYLRGFVEQYDAAIVSSKKFAQKLDIPQVSMMPAIDPFTIKNRQLSEEETRDRFEHYDIPTDLPLVVQISRFDKWKDPEGVIEAFKIARKEVDATLVLLGNVATDDPEGKQVYESLLDCQEERIIIMSQQDTALVNALQCRADVVLQKSTREGFGITVTEAMWKGAAVIAGDVGGIPLQITDGENGFLVSSVEECAQRIVQLLKDKGLRERLGENAQETVKKNFLLTRLLEQHLDLYDGFRPHFRLAGNLPLVED